MDSEQNRNEADAAMTARLRAGDVAGVAPAGLRARVRADINAARRPKVAWFVPAAVAAGVALAAAAVVAVDDPDRAVIGDYRAARAAAYAVTAPGGLRPMFTRELAFRPPVVDAAEVGCTLTGGRVAKVHGQATAVLDYGCGGRVVAVYVNASTQGVAAPAMDRRGDYRVVSWRGRDLACRAVSEADAATTLRLAAFIQKHAQDI